MTELSVKELDLLKETIPHATRIGVLWNPTTPSHSPARQAGGAGSKKLGVQLIMVATATIEDFPGAFSEMSRERVDGFLVIAFPIATLRRESLAQLALQRRLPSVFGLKAIVQAGGLMSYGADTLDLWRCILKGASPADLPVEQASKYELVINRKTAKALGLTVPPTLLARADEVIE